MILWQLGCQQICYVYYSGLYRTSSEQKTRRHGANQIYFHDIVSTTATTRLSSPTNAHSHTKPNVQNADFLIKHIYRVALLQRYQLGWLGFQKLHFLVTPPSESSVP